jgi:hypothetical protein
LVVLSNVRHNSTTACQTVIRVRHHPEHGAGWTLYYEVGGGPAGDNPSDHFIPGDAGDVAGALGAARQWLELVGEDSEMDKITVNVGEPSLMVGFNGRWLIAPDSDGTRTSEDGHDAGAYWGVA